MAAIWGGQLRPIQGVQRVQDFDRAPGRISTKAVLNTFSSGPMAMTFRSAEGDLATSSKKWKTVAGMSFPINIPTAGPVLITFCGEAGIDGQQTVWFRAQLGQHLGEPFDVAGLWSGFAATLSANCFTWGIKGVEAKTHRLKILWSVADSTKRAIMDQRSVTVWYPAAVAAE